MSGDRAPDQHGHWTGVYGRHPDSREHGSGFADECLRRLTPGSHILELGCGTGNDAARFAATGHIVTATDFVEPAIAGNRKRLGPIPNLDFQVLRTDGPYPFEEGAFDAVYAHLSLHYFPHDITQGIISEIHRVLKHAGLLMFACKSPDDPLYGKGSRVEPDMYELNGHVRHFFSEDYARSLLGDDFTDVEVTAHRGNLYGGKSAWITGIARAG